MLWSQHIEVETHAAPPFIESLRKENAPSDCDVCPAGMMSMPCFWNTWQRFVFVIMALTFIAHLTLMALKGMNVSWQPRGSKLVLLVRYTILGVCYTERFGMLLRGFTAAILMFNSPGTIKAVHCLRWYVCLIESNALQTENRATNEGLTWGS